MKRNIVTILCLIVAAIGLILAVIFGVIDIIVFFSNWSKNDFGWNFISRNIVHQFNTNMGDYLWGTIGILLTFTATVFLFITFKEQRNQLKETKAESDRIRFETTYFNILGMLSQVQNAVNTNILTRFNNPKIKNIIDFYKFFQDQYHEDLDSNDDLKKITSSFNPLTTNTAEIEQYKGLIATEYETLIEKSDCNIGYLFRYIYNAMKFVLDDSYNKKDIKSRNRYLNILQAQLSNEELCFIFYDAISKYGQNKDGEDKFRQMLDNTHFLENIDPVFLLDRNHYKFYPKTAFKFLNRTELAAVSN